MERHCDYCHGILKSVRKLAWQDKIDVLKRELKAQQSILQRYCKTDNDIVQTSCKISELIAKKLKLHIKGELVKECTVTAAKLLAPSKLLCFKKLFYPEEPSQIGLRKWEMI